MGIRLFPDKLLCDDACYGLFRSTSDGAVDLPVTIEGDGRLPCHVVHSDPDHLAFLAGLIVVQAWVYGIDELGLPPKQRHPLLVVTDQPGSFRDAYLALEMPAPEIKKLYKKHREVLASEYGLATNPRDRRQNIDRAINADDTRTKLHNFFPAKQLLHPEGRPKLIAGREHLGRGDTQGAAVYIVRATKSLSIAKLRERFTPSPFLVLIDADGVAVPEADGEAPSLVYHESIFAPELLRDRKDGLVLCCLPDAKFERFASESQTTFIDPEESAELARAWGKTDGALETFLELSTTKRDRVLSEIARIATGLRNVLISLPVSVSSYETALRASGQPESLWYPWSVTSPLQTLAARIPEAGAIGDWEAYVLSELVSGFQELATLLDDYSPKRAPLERAIEQSAGENGVAAILVRGEPYAAALRWVLCWNPPLGLGLSREAVRVITSSDIQKILPGQAIVIPQAFDPHEVFTQLVKTGPRKILLILLRNELRFLGERFLRAQKLLDGRLSVDALLEPLCKRAQNLPDIQPVIRREKNTTLFSESEFQIAMRMFESTANRSSYESVLGEEPADETGELQEEELARLVTIDEGRFVMLGVERRITYVNSDDQIVSGQVASLVPGDRLIVIRPDAREFIASRILGSSMTTELENPALQLIEAWQKELADGMQRLGLNQSELLQGIQALGSKRETPAVIGQWLRGEALGPLDPNDLQRVAEVLGSTWLNENWRRVEAALQMLRTGHRQLGQRATRIIQRAAVGEFNISAEDEAFLAEIGVTFGQLQDAVTIAIVENISHETHLVPAYKLGAIYSAQEN